MTIIQNWEIYVKNNWYGKIFTALLRNFKLSCRQNYGLKVNWVAWYFFFFKLFQLEDQLVQFSSVSHSCPTLCDPMKGNTPGLPVYHQLPEFTQTHVHWVGDAIQYLILCCPLLLLPPIPPSIRVVSNESILCIRWPKYWSFSFSISSSNEHPGLISFRMDWLELLAVQGTLKSVLQHHNSKASILRCSAVFTVQLSCIHDHWKNHSLD